MNKKSFLSELHQRLTILSYDEREAAMKYYAEYFDDAGVENEQAVLSELGSPESIAQGILKDTASIPVFVSNESSGPKERKVVYTQTKFSAGIKLLLLIVLLPILLPLLLGLSSASFGIIIVLLSVLFALCVSGAVVVAAGAVSIFVGLTTLILVPLKGLLLCGTGLLLMGVGALLLVLNYFVITKLIIPIFRWIVNKLNELIGGRRSYK